MLNRILLVLCTSSNLLSYYLSVFVDSRMIAGTAKMWLSGFTDASHSGTYLGASPKMAECPPDLQMNAATADPMRLAGVVDAGKSNQQYGQAAELDISKLLWRV
jgi:hypothetical protein